MEPHSTYLAAYRYFLKLLRLEEAIGQFRPLEWTEQTLARLNAMKATADTMRRRHALNESKYGR